MHCWGGGASPFRGASQERLIVVLLPKSTFFTTVMESYRTQAADDPGRWAVIDGTMTAELVEKAVWERVSGLL